MGELATFEFNEQNYLYAEPRIRPDAVLMPIIKAEIAKYQPQQVLEIGNNYYKHTNNTKHTIIDEFSTARNKPLRVSPFDFEPEQKFDFIFCLDFFEHLNRNDINILHLCFLSLALKSLNSMGTFWFAASANLPNLYERLRHFPKMGTTYYGLKRTTKYLWKECQPQAAMAKKSRKRTDGLLIGMFKRES